MFCRKCGNDIEMDQRFCTQCGAENRLFLATMYAGEYQKGNKKIFSKLYDVTYETVLNQVSDFFPDNNEDLQDFIQEVYIKIIKKIDQYDPERPFPIWAATVARNYAIDKVCRGKKQPENIVNIPLSSIDEDGSDKELELVSTYQGFNPDAFIDSSDRDDIIRFMIDSLPEDKRAIIIMFYIQGWKIKEIALELNLNENTVKTKLRQGRRIIEQKIYEYQKKHKISLYSMSPFTFYIWLLSRDQKEKVQACKKIGHSAKFIYGAAAKKITGIILGTAVAGCSGALVIPHLIHNSAPEQVYEEVYENVYEDVLTAYRDAASSDYTILDGSYVTETSELCMTNIPVEELYFSTIDLNEDGTDELFIGTKTSYGLTDFNLFGAYTNVDGQIFRLGPVEIGYRTQLIPCKDGKIEIYGSGGAQFFGSDIYVLEENQNKITWIEGSENDFGEYFKKFSENGMPRTSNTKQITQKDFQMFLDSIDRYTFDEMNFKPL